MGAGDKFGRPLNRDVQGNFCLHTNNWWNTSLEDSGPWYFRPMTRNAPNTYDEDLRPRRPCFRWNYTTEMYDRMSKPEACLSEEVTIDEETGAIRFFSRHASDMAASAWPSLPMIVLII